MLETMRTGFMPVKAAAALTGGRPLLFLPTLPFAVRPAIKGDDRPDRVRLATDLQRSIGVGDRRRFFPAMKLFPASPPPP